ncbi:MULTISPECIES: Uma2 family endonuclease [Leptolyngbya]|uniref:Uma2 family endonuclease n=1 Tax=Leptolyngbya TaxID=47251 RepID=UPI0032209E68
MIQRFNSWQKCDGITEIEVLQWWKVATDQTMTAIFHQRTQADRRITYSDRTWTHFKLMQQSLEGVSGVHLSYFNGEIELFMPGRDHEFFSRIICYLIMTFCFDHGIHCFPTGSMTQEKEGECAIEADESYCIGDRKSTPDLSIEVVFTSGSETKLAKYQVLEVPEVWFWEDGVFALYGFIDGNYQRLVQSRILPGLDIDLLTRCVLMAETNELEAIATFRQGL